MVATNEGKPLGKAEKSMKKTLTMKLDEKTTEIGALNTQIGTLKAENTTIRELLRQEQAESRRLREEARLASDRHYADIRNRATRHEQELRTRDNLLASGKALLVETVARMKILAAPITATSEGITVNVQTDTQKGTRTVAISTPLANPPASVMAATDAAMQKSSQGFGLLPPPSLSNPGDLGAMLASLLGGGMGLKGIPANAGKTNAGKTVPPCGDPSCTICGGG